MKEPQGRRRVRKAIEAAVPAGPALAKPACGGVPAWMAEQFRMDGNGLHKAPAERGKSELWVSGPFVVEAETRDEDGRAWGLLLSWRDRDGVEHREAFSRALFAGDCPEVRARLADGGLPLNAGPAGRHALSEYLNICSSPIRARSVGRIGWHRMQGGPVFVLPDAVFGDAAEKVVLQAEGREPSLFNPSGSLAGWRSEVAWRCIGNSRLLFAVSCGFAGPLLHVLEEDGGGFNLRGASRVGKSTALHAAASVWGGVPGRGAGGFVRQWRATGNGIEGIAAAHSDALLPLDEMGQVDARDCGEVAYMLANGQGKARAGRTGLARAPIRFRVLFLSTGEIGLADKNAEAGRATKAGQEVRLVDIAADAGQGCGLFEDLKGSTSANAFAEELKQATAREYGTAAPAFLERIVGRWGRDPEWPDTLRGWVNGRVKAWLQPYPEAGGQVLSVARRFALVALGGELATREELTGWPADAAAEAAHSCFRDWLAERGTSGAREDDQAVSQVRAFVGRHGPTRFERWDDAATQEALQGEPDQTLPAERFRTPNRAGWRRLVMEPDGRKVWRFYLTPDAWGEALGQLNKQAAAAVLVARGFLLRGPGKNSITVAPPGHKKVRVYEVSGDILGADGDD